MMNDMLQRKLQRIHRKGTTDTRNERATTTATKVKETEEERVTTMGLNQWTLEQLTTDNY